MMTIKVLRETISELEGFDANWRLRLFSRELRVVQLTLGLDGEQPLTTKQIAYTMDFSCEQIRLIRDKAVCKLLQLLGKLQRLQEKTLRMNRKYRFMLHFIIFGWIHVLQMLANVSSVNEQQLIRIASIESTEIEYLNLSVRSYNLLRTAKLTTIYDVIAMGEHLLDIHGLGYHSLLDIYQSINQYIYRSTGIKDYWTLSSGS